MTSILKVTEIQDPTNSNTALSIDTSGIVSQSNPVIMSGQIGTQATSPSAAQTLKFNEFFVNKGGITHDTSNGKFTVPVAGVYHITLTGFKNTGATGTRVLIGHNELTPTATSHKGHSYSDNSGYSMLPLSSIIECAASDFIVFYLLQGTLYNLSTDKFNQFTIAKIA
jgi:hypothetical protein